MDFDTQAYHELFLAEAQEHLQRYSAALLALERDPAEVTHVQDGLRALHTIKGMASTMGYDNVVDLAHGVESYLVAVRDRATPITAAVTDHLLQSLDALESVIHGSGTTRSNPTTRADGHEQPATPSAMARVRADHLDRLLNLIGALVSSSNRLQLAMPNGDEPGPLQEGLRDHRKAIGDLRDAVLQVRAQPVGQTFHRFPRMVRDLARAQAKQVECRMLGLDIELDRALLDRVAEALVHLLRNAVTHGIETTEERVRAGKPARATVRLSARQESGQVLITVEDDGRGLDVDSILRRACEAELLPTPAPRFSSDQQLLDLICHPGLSSARSVDEAAGRGVGLDAVRRLAQEMGGRLDLRWSPGHGCCFSLYLPLTLAILPAFLVRVAGELYALPMASIDATMELFPEDLVWDDVQPTVRHSLGLLSFYDLGALLGRRSANVSGRGVAALVTVDGEQVALGVGDLVRWEDIVVKPLPRMLRGVPGLAGCAIVGEGRVVLILDAVALLSATRALEASA